MNNEKENKNLIDDLKNLPKVDAPPNFEAGLLRKINSAKGKEKTGFWENLLSPGKLFPGAIAVATAVIILFIVDNKSQDIEDPLNIEPRIREDVVAFHDYDTEELNKPEPIVKPQEKSERKLETQKKDLPQVSAEQQDNSDEARGSSVLGKNDAVSRNNEFVEGETLDSSSKEQLPQMVGSTEMQKQTTIQTITTSPTNEIKKDNLNFMQINLSAKEKQQVEALKQRVQSSEKAKPE